MASRSDRTWPCFAAAWLAGLFTLPAQAAEPADVQLSAWIAQTTDLAPSQVALVTPEQVYTLEPLGPRLATDEVIALVRIEARDAAGTGGGARSWEAHLLFDCKHAKLRVIRSASFPEHNRKGPPQSAPEEAGWQSPAPEQPAARLMAAACEPAYAWPLRASAKVAAAPDPAENPKPVAAEKPPEIRFAATAPPPSPPMSPPPSAPASPAANPGAAPAPTVVPPPPQSVPAPSPPPAAASLPAASPVLPAAAKPDAAPAAPRKPDGFVVQVARGPSEEGAQRALDRARKTLGRDAPNLTTAIEATPLGRHMRYTAVLGGFEAAEAAQRACNILWKADQPCFARPAEAAVQGATAPATAG